MNCHVGIVKVSGSFNFLQVAADDALEPVGVEREAHDKAEATGVVACGPLAREHLEELSGTCSAASRAAR